MWILPMVQVTTRLLKTARIGRQTRLDIRGILQLPSLGGEVISSFITLVTSLSSTTVSSAQPLWALVISWRIAVRKPCGLKNPVIQNTFGRPSNSQPLNCAWRSSRSVNQNPIVADSHEIYQAKNRTSKPQKNVNSTILSDTPYNHSYTAMENIKVRVIHKLLPIRHQSKGRRAKV